MKTRKRARVQQELQRISSLLPRRKTSVRTKENQADHLLQAPRSRRKNLNVNGQTLLPQSTDSRAPLKDPGMSITNSE